MLLLILAFLAVSVTNCLVGAELPELAAPEFRFVPLKGLEPEDGVCRRDPSDVIKVGDNYYVWYTKVREAPGEICAMTRVRRSIASRSRFCCE